MADTLMQGSADSVLPRCEQYLAEVLVPLIKGSSDAPEHSLGKLRNRLAHGGGINRAVAERLDEAWRPRLEQAWRALTWLNDLELLGAGSDGIWRALSGRGGVRSDVAVGEARGMVLRSGGRDVPLWPFLLHCAPEGSVGLPVQQIYVRRGHVSLQYSALASDEHIQTESDAAACAVLDALLGDSEPSPLSPFVVRSFEQDLRRDAHRLLGRDAEVAHVIGLAREEPGGLLRAIA